MRIKRSFALKQVDRSKVCLSCEADVGSQATYCPFCGTDLLSSDAHLEERLAPQDERFQTQSLEESLASLYKPPYSIRNRQGIGVPDEREESPFQKVAPKKGEDLFQKCEASGVKQQSASPAVSKINTESDCETQPRGGFLPLLFLSVGVNLIVLGLLILFFSKGGIARLEWNSSHWFVYLLTGFPTTYAGVRLLKRIA